MFSAAREFIKTVKLCWDFLKTKAVKNKRLLLCELVMGLSQEGQNIVNMVFPAVLLQLLVDAGTLEDALIFILIVAVGLQILGFIAEYTKLAVSNYSLRAINYMLLNVLDKNTRIDYSDCESKESCERYDKARKGLWECDDMEYMLICVLLSKLVTLAATAYIFCTVSIWVFIGVMGTLLLQWVLEQRNDGRVYVYNQEIEKFESRLKYMERIQYDVNISKEFRIFSVLKNLVYRKYEYLHSEVYRIKSDKMRQENRFQILIEAIDALRLFGIYVFALWRYIGGGLPLGNFLLYIGAVQQSTYAVWNMIYCFSYLHRSSRYYGDYLEYMNMKEAMRETGKLQVEPNEHPFLEFRNVFFRYPNSETYALRDVNVIIRKGESIALVGDNGAGKSTFVKLAMRLYRPTDGEILLYGHNIMDYNYEDYLKILAPVFQEYKLFSYTLGENIYFDRPEPGRVSHIVDILGLAPLLQRVEGGLDAPYSKQLYCDGVELSGGEQQKITIARALYKGGDCMICDEPAASMDAITESEVYQALNENAKDKALIYISHRMSMTRFCHRILVFREGQIVEEGTHGQLMENEGIYWDMYEKQAWLYKEKKVCEDY